MKNQTALALAFNRARAKKKKIAELGITPEMTEEDIEALVIEYANHKASKEKGDVEDHLKGVEWYINDLVEFSKMSTAEQLDHEYNECFGEVASEDEMLQALENM